MREPGAMTHQLVRERPAHSLEEQRVVRMLQYAPVPLLLDVLEVFARLALRRIVLAHVTEPAGEFRELFAVGALTDQTHREVLRHRAHRPGEKGHDGLRGGARARQRRTA